MAQPATNAKIEELRYRLKTDPKSRLFSPLAEELRKAGQAAEAEEVLRSGLIVHPTYLSAWVSLGRVLRDQKKDEESVEALARALQLDPGNVVAARLLGDAYLSLGDKVEAIKKYKLVHALMPADEELEAMIESLDRELHPELAAPEPPQEAAPPMQEEPEESPFDRTMPPFNQAAHTLGEEMREEEATGDVEPMLAAHDESPFEEPLNEYATSALTVEAPVGMHVEEPVVEGEASGAAGFSPPEVATEDSGLKPAAPPENEKIARLEGWLSKVSRKEAGGV